MPVWHVSLAVLNESLRTVLTSKVNRFTLQTVRACALKALEGVGEGPARFEKGNIAFHLRRKMTAAEIAGLSKTWCSIAPIDDGGNMTLIEWIP